MEKLELETNMSELDTLLSQLREDSIVSIKALPLELEIEPTEVVIEMNTERDGMDILGRCTIVKIEPGGKIWDDEGNNFQIDGDQNVYALEDLLKLKRAALAAAIKLMEEKENERFIP
jgi:hypothetical protein